MALPSGPGSFPRILTFTGGRLVDIEAISKP